MSYIGCECLSIAKPQNGHWLMHGIWVTSQTIILELSSVLYEAEDILIYKHRHFQTGVELSHWKNTKNFINTGNSWEDN